MKRFSGAFVFFLILVILFLLVVAVKQRTQICTTRTEVNTYEELFQTLSEKHYVLTEMIRLSIYDSTTTEGLRRQREAIEVVFEMVKQSPYFSDLPVDIQSKISEIAIIRNREQN